MKREKAGFALKMLQNSLEIEKALDVLTDYGVLSYIALCQQEKLFDRPSSSAPGDISNKSAFLEGVNSALNMLNDLPDALKTIKPKYQADL